MTPQEKLKHAGSSCLKPIGIHGGGCICQICEQSRAETLDRQLGYTELHERVAELERGLKIEYERNIAAAEVDLEDFTALQAERDALRAALLIAIDYTDYMSEEDEGATRAALALSAQSPESHAQKAL